MIIDGKQIKEKYLNKIKEEITGKKITLAVIQVGNDEASSVYVKQKEKIKEFVTELCERYQSELHGERPVLFKMKELWHYLIQSFDADEKIAKKIKKAQKISEYEITINELFSKYDLKI